MRKPSGQQTVAALLSFNAGYVDAAGFLGLQGLFTSHVTGNFVTLGAALVFGHQGIVNKILALPEFVVVVALARLAGGAMRKRQWPVLRIFLIAETVLLAGFYALAVIYGPFPNADTPIALAAGFAGVAAMALQNAVQRVHFASLPPTTIMTGNTTQATIDAVDLATGAAPDSRPAVRRRFGQLAAGIVTFAAGCALSALLFYFYGFWCLLVAVAIGAIASILPLKA
jgi:uncharacterized membrane protein YoaK (UPF0700 family)